MSKPTPIPVCATVGDLLCELRRLDPELPLLCGMGDGVQPTIVKEIGALERFALMLEEPDEYDLRDDQ